MRRCFILALVLFTMTSQTMAGQTASSKAPALPLDLNFTLAPPQTDAHRQYLGLAGTDRFTLDQVKADILVIEIFSMYCPFCQREAPRVNELYERLNAMTDTPIRLIGIGAGNSDFETNYFKTTYKVEFPLFSDNDFLIHKKIGEKGTPFFIVIDPDAPDDKRILFTRQGAFEDLDAFVDQLRNAGAKRR